MPATVPSDRVRGVAEADRAQARVILPLTLTPLDRRDGGLHVHVLRARCPRRCPTAATTPKRDIAMWSASGWLQFLFRASPCQTVLRLPMNLAVHFISYQFKERQTASPARKIRNGALRKHSRQARDDGLNGALRQARGEDAAVHAKSAAVRHKLNWAGARLRLLSPERGRERRRAHRPLPRAAASWAPPPAPCRLRGPGASDAPESECCAAAPQCTLTAEPSAMALCV